MAKGGYLGAAALSERKSDPIFRTGHAGRYAADGPSGSPAIASEMAENVTGEAPQILGGTGYTKLHPFEGYWRDARLTKIFEGTSEIQQRLIAHVLLVKPTTN